MVCWARTEQGAVIMWSKCRQHAVLILPGSTELDRLQQATLPETLCHRWKTTSMVASPVRLCTHKYVTRAEIGGVHLFSVDIHWTVYELQYNRTQPHPPLQPGTMIHALISRQPLLSSPPCCEHILYCLCLFVCAPVWLSDYMFTCMHMCVHLPVRCVGVASPTHAFRLQAAKAVRWWPPAVSCSLESCKWWVESPHAAFLIL